MPVTSPTRDGFIFDREPAYEVRNGRATSLSNASAPRWARGNGESGGPRAGRTLTRPDVSSNTIVSVDWAGLKRITSSAKKPQFIKIEIFRLAIERVLRDGAITREEINQHYTGRASSGITLILAQVPLLEVGGRPQTIRWKGR